MRACIILALMLLTVRAALAQDYSNDWNVNAMGGGHAESESYKTDGTIGQTIIGFALSEDYSVEGGFWGGRGSSCGFYIIGDYNGSGVFNVADIVDGYSKLKTGLPEPAYECECPYGSGNEWPVAMDVNNSCAFNVADVVDGYSKLKTGSPELEPCEECPPVG